MKKEDGAIEEDKIEVSKKSSYAFPELGVTVEADNITKATKKAQMHPDVIYPQE